MHVPHMPFPNALAVPESAALDKPDETTWASQVRDCKLSKCHYVTVRNCTAASRPDFVFLSEHYRVRTLQGGT